MVLRRLFHRYPLPARPMPVVAGRAPRSEGNRRDLGCFHTTRHRSRQPDKAKPARFFLELRPIFPTTDRNL